MTLQKQTGGIATTTAREKTMEKERQTRGPYSSPAWDLAKGKSRNNGTKTKQARVREDVPYIRLWMFAFFPVEGVFPGLE